MNDTKTTKIENGRQRNYTKKRILVTWFTTMRILYSFLTRISFIFIWGAQLFSPKMKLFVKGRKHVFSSLRANISEGDNVFWFHCASLGEFEQGVPIMEGLKKQFPDYKLVVTFFSPSGYEVKKNDPIGHAVTYLPLDTGRNARKFLDIVNPKLAVFVKYEFWPNYLFEMKRRDIPLLLVSGLFRNNQPFFKGYGGFMRKSLRAVDHFFVQDHESQRLLEEIGFDNVTVSGDTRFDRVSHQIEMDNRLDFMDSFLGDSLCVVGGSTWPEDETVLLPFINSSDANIKFIIAPHKIDASKIENFRKQLTVSSALYSEHDTAQLSQSKVLIVDTIGLLTKIYSYADIAYVGGAMGTTGLHNILEPATFGVPVVIGNNYDEFPEAIRLRQLAGLFSVSSPEECVSILSKLVTDKDFRSKTGMISGHFVNSNTGATQTIVDYVQKLHSDGLI